MVNNILDVKAHICELINAIEMTKLQQNEYAIQMFKSTDFKTIGINGVFGGLTLHGNLNMNFFVEYNSIPTEIKHRVLPNGSLGEEIGRLPIDIGMKSTREIVFGVNLDIEVAKRVRDWMTKHIETFENNIDSKTIDNKQDGNTSNQ